MDIALIISQKECVLCGKTLDFSSFRIKKNRRDGYLQPAPQCKPCENERAKVLKKCKEDGTIAPPTGIKHPIRYAEKIICWLKEEPKNLEEISILLFGLTLNRSRSTSIIAVIARERKKDINIVFDHKIKKYFLKEN